MKIVVFANSSFAFPAIQSMAQRGLLFGICTVHGESEEAQQLTMLANQYDVKLLVVTVNNFKKAIRKQLQEWQPDVVFVMTFPFKIPKEIMIIPKKGFYNFHYALLPEYRGAQPVFWEIVNRESYGAVCVHKMDEGFDTGPILVTEKVAIHSEETYGTHVANLANTGVNVFNQLYDILSQSIEHIMFKTQDESNAKVHPRPVLKDLIIDWENQNSNEIRALIKACNPWNKGAYSFFGGRNFKITEVTLLNICKPATKPGEVIELDLTDGLVVQCNDAKALRIDIVYVEEGFFIGSKLADFGLEKGTVLTTLS